MSKKLYSCKKCGMTHYSERMPRKCSECGRKFNIKEKEILEVYQI